MTPQELKRFFAKVTKTDACWLWTGALSEKGYGLCSASGELWRAHRLAWHHFNGPIPTGMHVLHRCDRPPCVNPEHLFLGTDTDNLKDCYAKGRRKGINYSAPYQRAAERCSRGHRFDTVNTHWRPNGRRECRTCRRERQLAWLH